MFARKYANDKRLDNDQLLRVVEEHAGCIVNGEEPSIHLAEEVCKAATVRQGVESSEARVGAKMSAPENYVLQNPKAVTLYRSTNGTWWLEWAEHTSTAPLVGCATVIYQHVVKGKLKDGPK